MWRMPTSTRSITMTNLAGAKAAILHLGSIRPSTLAIIRMLRPPISIRWCTISSAWLGLVPKQESTGDRTILGKISKRGNKYLRTLFVQAAHVILARRPSAAMRYRNDFCNRLAVGEMTGSGRCCSLIPGLGVKLSTTILAGPTVLSAVGACPPHDGVR